MTLNTWTFTKRRNSTAQPTATPRAYNVVMKENTSIERPVFILGTGITSTVNYCQWSGNYYFIDDIVLISADQVELHCSLDVLATHKTAIGSYTCHIDRSASRHDSYLIDEALSAQQNIVAERVATTELFPVDQTGCYLMRVVSQAGGTGLATYVLSQSRLDDVLNFLNTESNFNDVLTDSIVKTFFNPFQYIVSLMWFPMATGDFNYSANTLKLGWWEADNQPYHKLSTPYLYNKVNLNLPTNYYTADFRAYTKGYTELTAYIPGIGSVSIDPIFLSANNPQVEVMIDYITGGITVNFIGTGTQGGVSGSTIDLFGSYSGQLGVSIPVGQVAGMGHAVTGTNAQGFGSLLEAGLSGAVAGVADVIGGIKNAFSPQQSVIGNQGNIATILPHPRLMLTIRNYGCAEFPNLVYGMPLRRNVQIGTLSGFVKCMRASIPLPAPATEIDEVNRLLNSGFYYE